MKHRPKLPGYIHQRLGEPGRRAAAWPADLVNDLGYHSVALVKLGFPIAGRLGLEPVAADDVKDLENASDLPAFVARRLGPS